MATYTSNYNLEKPEASDPFGDFRQSYNSNMDIIDQNLGGGGGGGHTIIDPNGSDMAQRAGLQFTGSCSVMDDAVNDKTVVNISGGGGNVYGAFLDPSRVIYSAFTFDSSAHTWTATEDVILTDNLHPVDGSTASYILIDGKGVFASYTFGDPFVYVKKGQVVTYRGKSGSNMKAYGILQGTSGIFAPVIYSDTERKIGIWRDNKPLYKKTIPYSFTPTSDDYSSDIETLSNDIVVQRIESDRFLRSGYLFNEVIYPPNTLYYRYSVNEATHKIDVRVWNSNTVPISGAVTIYYTKTTDTAGSGDWNTDGVPTVHYSTNEQVIGTYLGKPLYQKTWDNLTVAITANVWANTGISATDIETIVDGTMQDDNLQKIDGTIGFMSSHTYIGVYPQLGNRDLTTLTVQYTKISD